MVELSLEQPAPAFSADKAATVALPEITLHAISQETGQIAVVKEAAAAERKEQGHRRARLG